MKWCRPLAYIATLALGGAIGWFVEWYTSPMAKPMCLESGAEFVALALRELAADYRIYWALVFAVAGVVVAIPFYGIWHELRQRNQAGKAESRPAERQ
jgi:hypothetical protein